MEYISLMGKRYYTEKQMKLTHKLFILLVVSVLQIPFSSVYAQEKDAPFTIQLRTDRGELPMTFRVDKSNQSVAVGFEEYNRPAIPIETKGEIFIPDSITTPDGRCLRVCWLSRGSFQCCQDITKIHLAHTIESISDLAFQGCKSLREITLPDSLQVIYPQAFSGCDALRRIILRSPNPPKTYTEGTFEGSLFTRTTILIPYGSADKYRVDNLFSRFRYHAELIPTYPGR